MKKLLLYALVAAILVSIVLAADTPLLSINLVNQDPDPSLAGNVVELRFGIENIGGAAAEDVTIQVVPSYPFSLVEGEEAERSVGSLQAYQQGDDIRIVRYKVLVDKDATAGSYELKVRYNEGGSTTTTQKSVWVEVSSSDRAEIICIDKVELIPGKIAPLTFTIKNVGSAPLRELVFRWENEEDIILPVGSDNTRYIKYLAVDDEVSLSFDAMASAVADPDLYTLDLALEYDDPLTGEETTVETKAGIYVGGSTDFDVAYSDESGGEYSFSIANIGTVSASSVTVRIPSQEGWSVTGSDSAIIGNLNTGDYTVVSFALSRTRRQADVLLVDIIYTDSNGNRVTVNKEISLNAGVGLVPGNVSADGDDYEFSVGMPGAMRGGFQRQSPLQQFWQSAKWLVFIVLVVVIAFFLRRKYKREKLEDPDYTVKQLFGLEKRKR
ncbi:COG1361 S-layer family protein [Candidatus Woesearchaeota archaeon]|nr:COG1361 S-layer family protein [Candidatus Woesearchaeota archaeon]